MNRGLAEFLAALLSTKNRNMFSVRLGASVLLGAFSIPSSLTWLFSFPIRCVLGLLLERGIFILDVSLDSLREGTKLKEFERDARAAYEKATAKVYDEDEKQKIRVEYLRIISRIGVVGDGAK